MFNFILDSSIEDKVALIIIGAIALILLVVWLVVRFMNDRAAANENTDNTSIASSPANEEPSNDAEIIAVIAAAIAAAESESNGIKFRVVSFKRTKFSERN